MKSIQYTLLTFVIITLASCTREVEDRLPDDWAYNDISTVTVTYNGNTSSESESHTGNATFDKDGTGVVEIDGISSQIEWETKEDSVFIFNEGTKTSFFVEDNSRDQQVWKSTVTETGDNYSFTTEFTITLTQ